MTEVRDLLRGATGALADAGVPSPGNDAEVLLAHVLGLGRGALAVHGPVAEQSRERFEALVARRAAREPLQHLTGETGFRYVDLQVGPGVFTPRPETELLAGWAIEAARGIAATGEVPVVVDLCTGSGAIAASVAGEVAAARVHAVELDPDAFTWALRNLAGTGVDLREGDMADAFADLDGCVDVVVCNPPYIPLTEFEGVDREAREHDPHLALFSGADGLDAIRVLERVAARLLRPGGVVGAEHADLQGESAPAVFARAGRWTDVRDHLDLAGRPRYLTARLAR
ncbi:peptide chain release factor N(5)-glutamine methyltransferase [Marmoricola sp. RAF53]|uniref:peptide chain release factor N(5)-glutamine methyltransferase n=1 Tax=Marmoricola sp. RAF53 TaxID=3233059 RepID=UPI003F9ACDB4